ncbi:MAG TPA: beta-N-acetylglucosaminidase domain-containing protein [Longimicrobiales bacterium]
MKLIPFAASVLGNGIAYGFLPVTGFSLGVIEGYYGKPWSWQEREDNAQFLAKHGYEFYLYAPKADPHLRRLWRELHPDDVANQITRLSSQCRAAGVRFGVGLSPTKLHIEFGAEAKQILQRKLESLEALNLDFLALLFDDMRGDVPDLARHQIEITHWVSARIRTKHLVMCPSYYTDDPVLDRVFGRRPEGYLEELGRGIDPAIDIFWTGEEVISREVSIAHIDRVSEQFRRKPFLWDNYPVNDGERMSQFLHVRAFTGRPAALKDHLASHGVNPALQPTLTRVPAVTLALNYKHGSAYQYGAALREAAADVLGAELGRMIYEDLLILQDIGLDRLGEKEAYLRERYEKLLDHAAAREVVAWLNGEYRITDAIIQAQSGED